MFKSPRMFGWLLLAVALVVLIAIISPQQLPVALYKLGLITLAGVVGYWLDRALFPYSRPDFYLLRINWKQRLKDEGEVDFGADVPVDAAHQLIFAAAMIRRALIVGACILGVAMGL